MKPSPTTTLRLLLALSAFGFAGAGLASYDPFGTCDPNGGTGLVLGNDNGLKAPFGYDPCDPNPFIHIYKCTDNGVTVHDYNGNKTLFLGRGLCECGTPSTGCQDYCTEPPSIPIVVCGGQWPESPGCIHDDGLNILSWKVAPGGYNVTFGFCYKAVNANQPVLNFRIINQSIVDMTFPLKKLTTCNPLKPPIKTTLFLSYGDHDVHMTVHDIDCLPDFPAFGQTAYIGGETENFVVHVYPPPTQPAVTKQALPPVR